MAKKVVATLQDKKSKKFTKVYVPIRSESGSYTYRNSVIASDDVEKFIKVQTSTC